MPLVVVHHANQFLITDGYEDREGIDVIASGYTAILRLHERHGIPLGLHLSGTLIEALAWHRPDVLELTGALVAEGLVDLVGGAYAPAILPAFDDDYVRRQLHELLGLYAAHLGIDSHKVRVAWNPERVWDTRRLAKLLTDAALPNGGYRVVLLDDRLLFSTAPHYGASERARFDAAGPYVARPSVPTSASQAELVHSPYRIADGHGLVAVPIAASLRYAIPPRDARAWQVLTETESVLARDPSLLVTYADDLERAAGVGGWDVSARDAYAEFIRWLASSDIAVARLGDALDRATPAERRIESGTYYELAREWGAGEDYRGWLDAVAWRPYHAMLERSIERVGEAEREGGDARLLELAWKHVLACGYETGWHDRMPDGRREVAGWARALASHSRAAFVIAGAAVWRVRGCAPRVELRDVDDDGEDELVLASGDLYAVVLPRYGARLAYLFARDALVIGNPTDDWNLQEALGKYLEAPPNHPGAFADFDGTDDRYLLEEAGTGGHAAHALLGNVEPSSRLHGLRKAFTLADGKLTVRYERGGGDLAVETEIALSPDYLVLLREGRDAVRASPIDSGWEARCGHTIVRASGGVTWLRSPDPIGHAVSLRARIARDSDTLVIDCGLNAAEEEHSAGRPVPSARRSGDD